MINVIWLTVIVGGTCAALLIGLSIAKLVRWLQDRRYRRQAQRIVADWRQRMQRTL